MIFEIDKKPTDSIAIQDDGGNILHYGDFVNIVTQSKGLLLDRSLVFVLAENTVDVLSFIIVCLEHKWIPLVLNKDLDAHLLQNYVEIYKPQVIFTPPNCSLEIQVNKIEPWGQCQINFISDNKTYFHPHLSFLLPTSGSTGSPKLVRHSYENLTFSAKSVGEFFKLNSQDKALGILPIYYTMGFSVVTSHLQAGASVFLSKYSLTEKGFWDILKNEGITVLTGVPYTFEVLFKMRFERVKIPSLRIVTQGGGKLSDSLWDLLTTYATNNSIEFIPTYGQTEGSARMSYLTSNQVIERKGSIGKAIPGGFFEIWSEEGKLILDQVAEGELIYRGPNVTLGYAENLNDLEKSDERNGVLQTGDIVRRDEDGFYYIVGRKKRFLKIFGLRISLDEVELIIKNKYFIDCYAKGDDNQLEIYITDSTLQEEVKQWLSRKINIFHQNIDIKYIEDIPRNASGKVIFTT